MTLSRLDKSPYWWYGGKADAVDLIWRALGDVAHYAEPFFGSGIALLRRPHLPNRAYYSETINDLDGFVCNFWRAVQADPQAVAEACSWPVIESEVHARHVALVRWMDDGVRDRLAGDVTFYDAQMAGWWCWGVACWIGSEFAAGRGSWWPDARGYLVKRGQPGVGRPLPHIGNDGQGVNTQTAREPGVEGMPDMPDADWRDLVEADYAATDGFHPRTMPEIRRWMDWLSARMRHVRVLNGDWTRLCTNGALKTLRVRTGDDVAGVFLDPPYAHSERNSELYNEDHDVAAAVRAWCVANGNDPKLRIVLAGFSGEGHEILNDLGWREVPWFKAGFLKGGMAQQSGNGHQQHRERLWLSPHCLPLDDDAPAEQQTTLF